MSRQSTNHILLIKPASFYCNEQTAGTNLYQHSNQEKDRDEILHEALIEFHQESVIYYFQYKFFLLQGATHDQELLFLLHLE